MIQEAFGLREKILDLGPLLLASPCSINVADNVMLVVDDFLINAGNRFDLLI